MKQTFDHPSWEKQPLGLNKKECNDPYSVLEEFFEYANLPERRDMLWNWFESTVTGSFSKELNRRERSMIVAIYEDVQKLIEVAHILHMARKPNSDINITALSNNDTSCDDD